MRRVLRWEFCAVHKTRCAASNVFCVKFASGTSTRDRPRSRNWWRSSVSRDLKPVPSATIFVRVECWMPGTCRSKEQAQAPTHNSVMTFTSIRSRLRNIQSFIGVSRSLRQCLPLALLGWARGNPSSVIHRPFRSVAVKPSILCGGRVTVNIRDLGQLVSFEEIFVERTYDLSLVPFVPKHIFDCGAHVGYFT